MNPGIYNGPPSLPAQRGKKRDPCRVPEAPSLALSRRRQGELLINNGDKCRKSIPESCQTDLDGYGMGRGGRRPWARGGLPPFQVLWTDSSVIAPHLGLAGAPGVQASTRLPRPKAASFGAERGASPRRRRRAGKRSLGSGLSGVLDQGEGRRRCWWTEGPHQGFPIKQICGLEGPPGTQAEDPGLNTLMGCLSGPEADTPTP